MIMNAESSFVSYQLTEEEFNDGSAFTVTQRAVLQNLLSEAAEEKVALTFDPKNPEGFVQQEAELQGKIGILKYLLSLNPPVVHNSESQS